MASNVGDKVLWTAVIVSSIAACWYIPYILKQVKEASAVTVLQPKPNKPQLEKAAEAAIDTSTLAELADGPSYNLTASAIRLTTSKFFKSDAKKHLLWDVASKNYDRRDKAINAFSLLLTNTALKENNVRSQFTDVHTFHHLVTALVNLLPEHDKAPKSSSTSPPPSPIRPPTRSAHESAILSFIVLLINEPRKVGNQTRTFYVQNAQPAIDGGIIPRWLKHYPFPCTLPEHRRRNFKRHDVVRLLRDDEWGSDDEPMSALVNMLVKVPTGGRQLAEIGLQSSASQPNIWTKTGSGEWRLTRGYNVRISDNPIFDDQGLPTDPVVLSEFDADDLEEGQLIDDDEMMARLSEPQFRRHPHPQRSNPPNLHPTHLRTSQIHTAGERSLRRRHRQAIVVAEAGMPLRQENILQRQPTETELNWQEEIAIAGRDQIALERIDGIEDAWEGPVPPRIDIDIEIQIDVEGEEGGWSDEGSEDEDEDGHPY